MRRAILEDISAKQRFNLGELMIRDGEIKVGRRCEYVKDNTISLGVDVEVSDNPNITRVSGRHAIITYNLETDTYLIVDTLSKNGTEIQRQGIKISVPSTPLVPIKDRTVSIPIQDGDFVLFGGYKTLYSQKKIEKRKEDGTRTSVFE